MIKMRGGIPALLLRLISKGSNQNPLKDLERGPFCLFEFKKFKLEIYIFKYICISLIKFINFGI